MSSKWLRALTRLTLVLIFLPMLITYLYFQRTISTQNICFIGPSSSSSSSSSNNNNYNHNNNVHYGIYSSLQPEASNKKVSPIFYQVPPPFSTTNSWYNIISFLGLPSSHTISQRFKASSLASSKQGKTSVHTNNKIQRIDNQWCLTLHQSQFCSTPEDTGATVGKEGKKRKEQIVFPGSGTWTNQNTPATANTNDPVVQETHIEAQCPKNPSESSNKKQSKKQRRVNKNLQQIVTKPTTTLLLCINFYLAYHYWNNRIAPSSVSKIYNRMMLSPPHEIWRSYSGAFAHFDLMHIGFNMMNLYSTGTALEGTLYSSLEFLYYNLALVVCTTLIMMGISFLRIHVYHDTAVGEASTVGYSAVLFAWMVVLAMEMDHTCPVPFLPEMCFTTYEFFGPFKFNAAPIVQLIIAQMIMPRVSFVGHLSGIICGFLLHWGLFPLSLVVPQLLLPAIMLIHLIFVQKVVPIPSSTHSYSYLGIDAVDEEDHDTMTEEQPAIAPPSSNSKETYKLRIKTYLYHLRNIMIYISIISIFFFDITMILSQILTSLFFYYAYQTYIHYTGEKQKSITANILRLYIFSVMILVLTDSITLASWLATTSTYLTSEIRGRIFSTTASILPYYIMIFLRISINVIGFIISTKLLTDLGEYNNSIVLLKVASFVMENAKVVGDVLFAPIFNPFEGRGVVLGTFRNDNNNRLV